jgi:hypothetical protein
VYLLNSNFTFLEKKQQTCKLLFLSNSWRKIMPKLVISDLTFLTELDNQETPVTGGASAGAAAATSTIYDSAVAAGGSSTNGNLKASANGRYSGYKYYSGGPSASVNANERPRR